MTDYKKTLDNYLGYKAKDKITGISGIITHLGFDLYGCIQVILTWNEKGDVNTTWLDLSRLEIKSKKPVMENPFNTLEKERIPKGEKGAFDKPLK